MLVLYKFNSKVVCRSTHMLFAVVKILYRAGYVERCVIGKRFSEVVLRRKGNIVRSISVVSKRGKRIYVSYKDLPKHVNGLLIISTPKGIMTSYEAINLKVGGEVLLYVC